MIFYTARCYISAYECDKLPLTEYYQGIFMSLIIHPIKAFTDNYIWTLINDNKKQAIVIDPGQAKPVDEYLKAHDLDLTAIWVTHQHQDHTGGVGELQQMYPMTHVVARSEHDVSHDQKVTDGKTLTAWNYGVQVWAVPGHTQHHLAYVLDMEGKKHVFCGDTLFSAGCGRVFTGTMEELFESFQRLNGLPEDSLFYPAHEYTANNLRFGLSIEPDNQAMQAALAEVEALVAKGQTSLPVTLAHEREVNVFLRIKKDSVIQGVSEQMAQRNQPLSDTNPLTIFTALRTLKDKF